MTAPMFIRIFISSPSDVVQERTLAHQVIDNLMHDALLRDKVVLKAVAWDKRDSRTPLLATMTPQEAINQGLARSSECDIVVVVLWSRMGTPLPSEYKKPDGSPYLSGTEYEFEDAMTAARACTLRPIRPQVLVYKRTETVSFTPDPDKPEKMLEQFQQWQRVQDFFKAFVAPDGSLKGGYNTYATPDDFRADLENDLKVIITRLLDSPVQGTNKTSTIPSSEVTRRERWQGSPFPGLRAFTAPDAPIFFGRGRETDELVARLAAPACRFVAVVGASGSGKSSLVGAGLLPRLMSNALDGSRDWRIVRFTPGELGSDPFIALWSALQREVPDLGKNYPRDLATKWEIWQDLIAKALRNLPEWAELLLFIDQFEELFTLTAESQRLPFVQMLKIALSLPRLRIVVTLRADFYHRCVEYQDLTDFLRSGSYPLAAPRSGALYEMIEKPANRAELEFAPGLAQRIVDDVGSDPGALALMAYLLDELYQLCRRENSDKLTFRNYEALGGVQGAIGTRAQHVFDGLDAETQAALPGVFRELVSVDDDFKATRQRMSLDRLTGGSTDSAAAKLITALTEARLLVQNEGTSDSPVVEVAHEALLRSWPTLANWIATAQEDLILLRQVRNAADQWEQHDRNKAFLWLHERLTPVYAMLERLKPDLDDSTRDFIKPELERLMDEIDDPMTNHRRRALIGDRLGEIGDNRPGVGLRPDGLPDIVWCALPWSEPSLFKTRATMIAKYPVTYLQYRAFLEAEDGYTSNRWWKGLRHEPQPGLQNRPTDNHPAENVSWYDAMAFCRWLSAKLGYEVRLPTEKEWQQSGTGRNPKNIYPWGPDWDSAKTNTMESGLSRTTAVGMYPQGMVMGFEIMDMSGSVWEWCLNSYKEANASTPDFIDFSTTDNNGDRVVRGGSFFQDKNNARTGTRFDSNLGSRVFNIGFRLVGVVSSS